MNVKDEKFILIPLCTLIICQLIKFTIESLKSKKLKWARLLNGSGGMPSSHTSFSMSLTTMIGLNLGFDSALFALSLVFSLIVAYDSLGVRMESGKQAAVINMMADEIFEGNPQLGFKHLKEELGHQPLEVLVGILLGVTTSLLYTFLFK